MKIVTNVGKIYLYQGGKGGSDELGDLDWHTHNYSVQYR